MMSFDWRNPEYSGVIAERIVRLARLRHHSLNAADTRAAFDAACESYQRRVA